MPRELKESPSETRPPVSGEPSRQALAKTIHAACPHGLLHPFDECPQRHHDEREADEIEAGLRARGFVLAAVSVEDAR
jgi:hypothetical protein